MQNLVGIDIDEALRRLMGNQDLLLRVAQGFVQEYRDVRNQIAAELDLLQFAVVAERLDRLKGVAANISANKIYETLVLMEAQVKAQDLQGAKLSFANLELFFDRLSESLNET